MKRRSFLKTVAASASVASSNTCTARPSTAESVKDEIVHGMPRRTLGRTGRRVSVIGYPGFALREDDRSQAEFTASIRHALDNGVNYFDVAPAYSKTLCEQRMGKAFSEIDGFDRESIFLACKTKDRTRQGAQKELENSLKLLKTDYFDLYQLHCLVKPDEDVERAFAADGVMEMIFKAKEQGKIRNIGFSAHTTKAALAALRKYHFDTVMFPINFVEMFTFGFGNQVLEIADQQGAAVLAIKPISSGTWPSDMPWDKRPRKWWYQTLEKQSDIDLALRFTLSQKAVVAGLPPAWLDLTKRAIEAGKNFREISDVDIAKLRSMAAKSASVFHTQQQVARHDWHGPDCPFGPHETCPGPIC